MTKFIQYAIPKHSVPMSTVMQSLMKIGKDREGKQISNVNQGP